MHCAIRNKNAKRNKICLTNTEETLDEGRFLEQKLGKHECRHQHISCGPDLTLDRNKNPGHCLQSQHFDEQLQSTVLYIDCRSTKTKTQTWEKLQPTIVKATDEYLAKTGRGWQKAQCWLNSWSSIRTNTRKTSGETSQRVHDSTTKNKTSKSKKFCAYRYRRI